jgi:hypothetical protein
MMNKGYNSKPPEKDLERALELIFNTATPDKHFIHQLADRLEQEAKSSQKRWLWSGMTTSAWQVASMGAATLALIIVLVWAINNLIPITDTSPAKEETPLPATSTLTPTPAAHTPIPTMDMVSPYITPPPATSETFTESVSPDGRWMAQYSFKNLDDGGHHKLLQIFQLDGDWKLKWTLLDEVESGIGGSEPIFHGWDTDVGYFFYSFRHQVGGNCEFFSVPDTTWERLNLISGQIDEFPLPFGYEHARSPAGDLLAYITYDPELALVIHDSSSQEEKRIDLPVDRLGPGEKAAGGLAWDPGGSSLILTLSAGTLCDQESPDFALVRLNVQTQEVIWQENIDSLVTAQLWHPSGKILLKDWNGYTWWINAASGKITSAVPAAPTATALPLTQPEIQATVVAQTPEILESLESPDGNWRAEVIRYDCVRISQYEENALEEIILRSTDGQEIRRVEEQFLNCGGIGAWGLGNLVWSADSRYLYYSTARESVPDGYGICLWERPLTRLEVSNGQRLQLTYGETSPSGDRWVMKQDSELVIWSYDEGELSRIASPLPERVFLSVEWMPDESSLVYALGSDVCMPFGPTQMGMVDLVSGKHTQLVEDMPDLEFSIVQGGQALLYRTAETVGGDTRYYLHGLSLFYLDLRTRQSRLLAQASDLLFYSIGREGKEIVYLIQNMPPGSRAGIVRLVYLNLENMQERLLAESDEDISFSLNQKGDWLVYVMRPRVQYNNGPYSLVYVDMANLSQTTMLEGEGQTRYSLSPDERHLAVLEQKWGGTNDLEWSSLSLIVLATQQINHIFESSERVFDFLYWEDNDTLILDWGPWYYHVPSGELMRRD